MGTDRETSCEMSSLSLLQIRCQNTETPKTALGISDTPSLPMPMSPETVKLEEPDRDSNHCNSQQTQPMQTCQTALSPLPLPPPATGPAKLVRRFSEQVRFCQGCLLCSLYRALRVFVLGRCDHLASVQVVWSCLLCFPCHWSCQIGQAIQ